MTSTTNYKLSKPEDADLFGDVLPGMMAANMDTIDEALYTANLFGKLEISVTTDTNVIYATIQGHRKNVIGAVMTLRNSYDNNYPLDDFEPPNVQLYSVCYRGQLYAVLKSTTGNIPMGTYTVDWKATEVS